MRDGIRSFVTAQTDVYAYNAVLSNTAFDLFGGNQGQFAVRTTIKDGVAGGTLNIAQPVHTGSAWNVYGGFVDVYSFYQALSVHDYGTWTHPHTGLAIPVRASFVVNSVGARGTHVVPTSAIFFDTTTNMFDNASSGLTSKAYVDFDFIFGEWHHGEMMSMDDVVATIAMFTRMA